MKFAFPCLVVLLAFTLVACSSVPGNRSSARAEPSLSAQEQDVLYNKHVDECASLRKTFEEARIVNRDLGRKWRAVRGRDRLSVAERKHFTRSYQTSHKFTHIQYESIDKMKENRQEIVSKIPSRDPGVCDTENLDLIDFPPTSVTDLY